MKQLKTITLSDVSGSRSNVLQYIHSQDLGIICNTNTSKKAINTCQNSYFPIMGTGGPKGPFTICTIGTRAQPALACAVGHRVCSRPLRGQAALACAAGPRVCSRLPPCAAGSPRVQPAPPVCSRRAQQAGSRVHWLGSPQQAGFALSSNVFRT